jgi:hypothetical protein
MRFVVLCLAALLLPKSAGEPASLHGGARWKTVRQSHWPVRLDLAIGVPALHLGAYSQDCAPMPRELGISPPSRGIVQIERTLEPPSPTGRRISLWERSEKYVRRMKSRVETRGATSGDPSPSLALVHSSNLSGSPRGRLTQVPPGEGPTPRGAPEPNEGVMRKGFPHGSRAAYREHAANRWFRYTVGKLLRGLEPGLLFAVARAIAPSS